MKTLKVNPKEVSFQVGEVYPDSTDNLKCVKKISDDTYQFTVIKPTINDIRIKDKVDKLYKIKDNIEALETYAGEHLSMQVVLMESIRLFNYLDKNLTKSN